MWLEIEFGDVTADVYLHGVAAFPDVHDITAINSAIEYLERARKAEPFVRQRVVEEMLIRSAAMNWLNSEGTVESLVTREHLLVTVRLRYLVIEADHPTQWAFASDAALDRRCIVTRVSPDFETVEIDSLMPPCD